MSVLLLTHLPLFIFLMIYFMEFWVTYTDNSVKKIIDDLYDIEKSVEEIEKKMEFVNTMKGRFYD